MRVRLAVECKNERKPVGKGMVQQFRAKLDEVGIPTQFGRMVSTSGYTRGAKASAHEAGISLLLLDGLDDSKASRQILEALQSVVYLVAQITEVSIISNSPRASTPELMSFFDAAEASAPFTVLPEMIRSVWLSEKYFRGDVNVFEIRFTPRDEVFQRVHGIPILIRAVIVTLQVVALVVDVAGTFSHTTLINIQSGEREKQRIDAQFDETASFSLHPFSGGEFGDGGVRGRSPNPDTTGLTGTLP